MLIDTEPLQGVLPSVEPLQGVLIKDTEYVFPYVEEETMVFTIEATVSEEGELII